MTLTSQAAKLRLLLALLPRQRAELIDRVRAVLTVQWERGRVRPGDYRAASFEAVCKALGAELAVDVEALIHEAALDELEQHLRVEAARIRDHSPFSSIHNGDVMLGRLCYAAARAIRPAVVVETGVAHGVLSSFILTALAANGGGELHSIDLPPLAANGDRHVGALIPPALKARWHLHRGTSRRVMPGLLARIPKVGLFVHDSLHTEENIRWELRAVRPHLQQRAVVISDDIDENAAFEQFVQEQRPRYSAVVREADKARLCGVAVFE